MTSSSGAGAGGDAHLDPLDPRGQEGQRDLSVGVERVDAVLEGLGQPGFARPPRAQHAAGDDARLLARLGHAGAQVGQDAALEHLGHLVGDAGDGVDDLVPDRADEARCRAGHLGDDGGALRHVGLPRVVGRHGAASRLEEAGDEVDDGLVAHERDAHDLGDGLPGDVVLGGPEPAAHDDAVAPGEGGAQRQGDAVVVVADGLVEVGGHPVGGQVLAQPGGVGVGNLAQEQLGAHCHDLDSHGADLTSGRPPGPARSAPRGSPCRPPQAPSAAVGVPPMARRPSSRYSAPV